MPYWRLSGFYLFYFASLGALLPYWGLYLKSLGYSALQIGELMAVLMATKIVAPNLWGWIADRTGRRMAVVRAGSLLAVLSFSGVFAVQGYWPMAAVMLAFSFFWNAALPQFEANTLSHLGDETHRYSSIRLWGSVGFIGAVAGLGPILDAWGPGVLPPTLLLLFSAIWVASLYAPERQIGGFTEEPDSLGRVLRRPEVIALLGVCFLMQASHGPYYTFYTIYLEEYGHSRSLIGQLWALGVVAEVGVFLIMHRLVTKFGLRQLLLFALGSTALRWWVTGAFPESLPLMALAQCLHAASFGVFHAVAIALFHNYFRGRHHGRGQALYSSLSFGAGGAVGAWYAGLMWESYDPMVTFGVAALLCLVAVGWAFASIRPQFD